MRCRAACFCPAMPLKTFAHGGAIHLAMDRPSDDLGIVIQRPDERMLVEERQRFLLRCLALEQLADRSQTEAAVRDRDFAGFFQRLAGVLFREREQSLQDARALDAPRREHGFRPLLGLWANCTDLAEQVDRSAFQAADLLGSQMLAVRAEPALFVA